MRKYVKSFAVASTLVAGLAAAPSLYAQVSHGTSGLNMSPGGTMGQGMMGRGMMGRGMMGQGMMDQGMMGHGSGEGVVPSKHLSADDVRHFLEHRLARRGNNQLKLGEVKEQDDDTIIANIVTVDESLVQRLKVDRHTGMMQHLN